MLTRLGNEGKGRAKSMARLTGGGADGEADRRRSGDGDRGRGSAAVLRAPGLRGSARGAPAVVSRGQDGLKATGGDGNASAELLTGGGRSALARRRR